MLRLRTSLSALALGLFVSATSAAYAEEPVPGTPPADAPPVIGGATDPSATAPTSTPPVVVVVPPTSTPSASSVKVEGKNVDMKFGFLLQPQFQGATSPVNDVSGMSSNLYLRRARILFGGTLFGKIEYFFDTDFANLFLPTAAGLRATPGINIQDAFATYKAIDDQLKFDVGYMLPPMAHNAVQGAGSLFGWDYFGFTFQHNNAFAATATGSSVGRDVGVQARGLVLDGRLEYRAGLFQGVRSVATATESGGTNFFRATGRVQINLMDAETGFFYAGSYLGAKKILSFGLSGDIQGEYKYFAVDGFTDLPMGPGLLTAQINYAHWNGGTTLVLPEQGAFMAEAGYTLDAGAVKVSPILRIEHLFAALDQTRFSIGAAVWPYGHNTNLKLFYTNAKTEGAERAINQINLQAQVYFF